MKRGVGHPWCVQSEALRRMQAEMDQLAGGNMNLLLQREPTDVRATTWGELTIDGEHECVTLEDAVREIPGEPVELWKIPGETAIPSGVYELTLEHSPKFGDDTITLRNVPGYQFVRMHGGSTIADTEGCVIVGDRQDRVHGVIAGALRDGVLARLKAKIKAALDAGDRVWLEIRNAT